MSGILAALTPKAEMSFAEIVDELHRLRSENGALKTQVSMLSELRGGLPLPGSSGHGAADTAATVDEISDVIRRCLGAELARIEASAECGRLQEAMAREELAMRCQELGSALEQRVLQAEQSQHAAVAVAQQQSAAAIAALEEQLAAMTEDAARREALADAYGADAEVAEAEQKAVEALARCEHKEIEVERLRRELDDVRDEHATALRASERTREIAEATAAEAAGRIKAAEAATRQLEEQIVRLSDGFNKQVEEVVSLQERLRAARASTVDKATARSWVVNFVENRSRSSPQGEEILRLMAEWWDFSAEDCQRVGLFTDRPHPDLEASLQIPANMSLTQAFATFLDEEAQAAEQVLPQSRSPTTMLPTRAHPSTRR